MHSVDINYLAVLVCAIIAMPIGAVWYGPFFGKAWMHEVGKTEEDLKKDFNPVKIYGLTFVGHFIIALIIAYVLQLVEASSVVDAVRIALTAWFGFVAAPMFIGKLFAGNSNKLLVINGGYYLVDLLVFSVVLVLW